MRKRLTRQERRKQIISESSALFASKNYSLVTIRMIAEKCGINEAMLYKHFPSKEALFSAVIEEKISRFRIKEFLESLDRDQPFGEILSKIAMHILSAGRKDPEANNLLLYSSLRGTPEAKKLFMAWRQPYVDFLEDIMTERIEKGTLRKLEPSIVARSFVGMVIDCSASCFLWREFGYDEFDPEKAVYNNVKIFTQGLELCSQEGGTDETS